MLRSVMYVFPYQTTLPHQQHDSTSLSWDSIADRDTTPPPTDPVPPLPIPPPISVITPTQSQNTTSSHPTSINGDGAPNHLQSTQSSSRHHMVTRSRNNIHKPSTKFNYVAHKSTPNVPTTYHQAKKFPHWRKV